MRKLGTKEHIKLALFHGWTVMPDIDIAHADPERKYWFPPGFANSSDSSVLSALPDYLNDLNAIHDVEKLLDPRQSKDYDGHILAIHGFDREILIFDEHNHATPEFILLCETLRHADTKTRVMALLIVI